MRWRPDGFCGAQHLDLAGTEFLHFDAADRQHFGSSKHASGDDEPPPLRTDNVTTYMDETRTCWACGHEQAHRVLASTSSFGPADLDLRPPPMQRDTIQTWVQTCAACGYVAEDVAEAPSDPVAVRRAMSDPKWIEIMSADPPTLTGAFRRLALIARVSGQTDSAGTAELWAAWAADDENNEPLAIECRRQAASLLQTWLSQTEMDPQTRETTRVQLVDVLRRATQWDAAALLCADLLAGQPANFIADILRFQTQLIDRHDMACYTLGTIKAEM